MKHKYLSILISFTLMLLTGCEIWSSDNGDLDGLWQMTLMEDLQTGETTDVRTRQLTWGVQGPLIEFGGGRDVIAKFELTGTSLVLRDFSFNGVENKPVEDLSVLRVYGINRLEEYFKVLVLDSDEMRLESADVRLTFRKY